MAARRAPLQQRSRERVQLILSSAADLIAASGADQLTMSEIAQRSGMSLAALYRYFPDKSSIVAVLANQFNTASRACIEAALADVSTCAGLRQAFSLLMDQYLAIIRREPVIRDIWSGMQADKTLFALQAAESQLCARLLGNALQRVHAQSDPTQLYRISLLLWELGEAAVRLALTLPDDEGTAIVDAYTRMALRELECAGRDAVGRDAAEAVAPTG